MLTNSVIDVFESGDFDLFDTNSIHETPRYLVCMDHGHKNAICRQKESFKHFESNPKEGLLEMQHRKPHECVLEAG